MIEQNEPNEKLEMNSCTPEELAVPPLHVTPVVLL
jgi:hypothetical protein